MNSRIRLLLLIAFVFCFGAEVWAFIEHRPLFGDSSYFLLNILENGELTAQGHARFSLLQIPALLLRYLDAPIATITRTYEAALSFHSIFSLVVCFLLLQKRQRLDLLVFPVLSFAICSQICYPFSTTPTLDVLSAFWPALLYFETLSKNRARDYTFLTLALVVLVLGHETAVVGLFLFVILSVVKLRQKRGSPAINKFVLVSYGLGSVWLAAKFLIFQYPDRAPFPREWFENDILPLIALAAVLLIFIRPTKPFMFAAGLIPLFYFVFRGDPWILDARALRYVPVPLATLLGGLMIFHRKNENRESLYLVATVFLIVFTFRDLHMTKKWVRICDYLRSAVASQTGCALIEPQSNDIDLLDVRLWAVPHLSILLQESRVPNVILFPRLPGRDSTFCDLAKQGIISVDKRLELKIGSYISANGK